MPPKTSGKGTASVMRRTTTRGATDNRAERGVQSSKAEFKAAKLRSKLLRSGSKRFARSKGLHPALLHPAVGADPRVCPNKEGSLREKLFKNLIQNLTNYSCSTDLKTTRTARLCRFRSLSEKEHEQHEHSDETNEIEQRRRW